MFFLRVYCLGGAVAVGPIGYNWKQLYLPVRKGEQQDRDVKPGRNFRTLAFLFLGGDVPPYELYEILLIKGCLLSSSD